MVNAAHTNNKFVMLLLSAKIILEKKLILEHIFLN